MGRFGMDTVFLELGDRVWVRAIEESVEEAAEASMGTGGNWHEGHAHRDDPLDDLVSSEGNAKAFTGSSITLKAQLLILAQTQMAIFFASSLR